jgi:hypothetical protein
VLLLLRVLLGGLERVAFSEWNDSISKVKGGDVVETGVLERSIESKGE